MSQYPPEREPGVMTEEPLPVVATSDDRMPDSPASSSSAWADPTTDNGHRDTSDIPASAKDAGQHVADVAKDQAGQVADEARAQAKDLLGQGREEIRQQAAQQQERVANGLFALSRELWSMARGSIEQGMAADLTREAAQRADAGARWLDAREPGQLLDEVRSFARQRPGAFLGIAAAAGLVVGRLGRGLKEGEPQAPRHAADPARHAAPDLPGPVS